MLAWICFIDVIQEGMVVGVQDSNGGGDEGFPAMATASWGLRMWVCSTVIDARLLGIFLSTGF
jgi:hypothetical protein